jgi:aminotransferase
MSPRHGLRSKRDRSIISKRVEGISPSGIRKFFDILLTMEDAISLGVGEPDFVTPWHVSEAGIYSIEKGYTMYTSNKGLLELRQELARYLNSRYRVEYDPETELLITVGVSEGLDLAMRSIINPKDEVLSPDPTYVSYGPCTVLAEGVFVPVPTTVENDFKVKAVDIEKRVTPRTKAILLGYPNNPTGLVYGVKHTCFASIPGMKERTILLGGFSKAYAMTGWRVGYAAARTEIIEAMTKVHQYTMLCAPIVAQMAATEALRAGDAVVKEMVADYDRRRRVMLKGFNDIGLACFEPKGAFYCFPSVKVTGLSSEEFAEQLLVEEKVAVVPGSAFGECGEGYVRCCYATALSDIEEALRRMGRFVERHR